MAAITTCSDFGAPKNSLTLFSLFPHLRGGVEMLIPSFLDWFKHYWLYLFLFLSYFSFLGKIVGFLRSSNGKESESHSVVSNSVRPHGLYSSWNSPCQNTGVGSLSLLQGIFPTQVSYRWILYQLSHQGSPRILECVPYPVSRGSTWPRNRTGVSCIAGRFFTNWAIREAHGKKWIYL